MMSANREILYWRKDKAWYKYDNDKKMYELTDKATDRAKASFELWKEFNKMK